MKPLVHAYYFRPIKDLRTLTEVTRVQQARTYRQTRVPGITVRKIQLKRKAGRALASRQASRCVVQTQAPRWQMACGAWVASPHEWNDQDTYRVFDVRLRAWEAAKRYVTCRRCHEAVENLLDDHEAYHAMVNAYLAWERSRDANIEPEARGADPGGWGSHGPMRRPAKDGADNR